MIETWMRVVVWCRTSADGDVIVGDPFYSEEQQDQQQFPFTEGKYNMGFPLYTYSLN